MPGRLFIAALFLAGLVSAVWTLSDWPPPRLFLKHGFHPAGGPTGRTMSIEGVEFVELKPVYYRMGSHFLCEKGDLLGRVCAVLRLPCGQRPIHYGPECPPHWAEVPQAFFLSRAKTMQTDFGIEGPMLVAWGEAVEYCRHLSDRNASWRFRLPTEAEWEYAARAGRCSDAHICLAEVPRESSGESNPWGIVGLCSEPWEWCSDSWRGFADSGGRRVVRGGVRPGGSTRVGDFESDRKPNVPGIGAHAFRIVAIPAVEP